MINQQPHSILLLPEVSYSSEQMHVLLHALLLRHKEPSFSFSLLPFLMLRGKKKSRLFSTAVKIHTFSEMIFQVLLLFFFLPPFLVSLSCTEHEI